MSDQRPAWSRESAFLQLPKPASADQWSPEWAMGGATGAGVRVAIVDSGIEADHPLLEGCVDAQGAMDFSVDSDGSVVVTQGPHDDVFGHGTACAGIIHALAPQAQITSVRVLGAGLRGKAAAFHAGLQWAVEQGFDVINLSLGAGKRDWAFPFHEVCDRGYFSNSFIVTAANNIQRVSFPSLYASVTSVACNTSADPLRFHFNPEPPTEFLARGIDVEVPWLNGETTVTTGNSFAAPHIAAFAALIKSKHPEMRPFHVKSLLWACAANVRSADEDFAPADRRVRPAATMVGRGTSVLTPPQTLPNQLPSRPVEPTPPVRVAAVVGDPMTTRLESALDGITVSGLLADGAWGRVYAGMRDTGERVALRVVDTALAGDESLVERFVASVRTAASLEHPHILPIEEFVETTDFAIIVMPQCPSNLAELERPVELADACQAALSVLAGLQVAHHAGVFHGDIRARNMLIDARRHVVVSDIGLAAPLQTNARTMVRFDPLEWTHRAPELVLGGAVGAHIDVYGVGSLLYEMLTGSAPRPTPATLAELVTSAATVSEPAPFPDTVPTEIATAVGYSLVHDPAYRWASVADFAASLAAACASALGSEWAWRSQFIADSPATKATGSIRAFGN